MVRHLDRLEQLAFAQLADLAQDGRASRFPANGSFVKAKRSGGSYWYYQGYEKSIDGSAGRRTRSYVGPVGDPGTEMLREAHEVSHDRYRERRRIAASLRRSGLPAPMAFDGAVVDALSQAGVFDTGAVLIGSMAFQTYSGLLGERLDDALMQTGDIDIARAQRVVTPLVRSPPGPDGSTSSLEELLKAVDPTFAPIFDRSHPGRHIGYGNKAGYKVEFLTNESRKTQSPTSMIEFGDLDAVSAQPVTFLEYLLEQPTRSVLLHDDGIPVVVPDPARYGVHKLIVAPMRERVAATRGGEASTHPKVAKDVSQAAALIETLHRARRANDVAAAWDDAFRRGPSWRRHLGKGVAKLPHATRCLLEEIVLSHVGPSGWKGLRSELPDTEDSPVSLDVAASRPRIGRPAKKRAPRD